MSFTARQLQALAAPVPNEYLRTRQINGRELRYVEGWFAISEANRIFGPDGWSRETIELRCIQARESRGVFTAIYLAKVRVTVLAGASTVAREGSGLGRANAPGLAEAHEIALKGAETDATKRALATFGASFGLGLYGPKANVARDGGSPGRTATGVEEDAEYLSDASPTSDGAGGAGLFAKPVGEASHVLDPVQQVLQRVPGLHPDDTTPIPRPSRYFGRERYHQTRKTNGALTRKAARQARDAARAGRASLDGQEILLPFGKAKRLRDKSHLKFVASQPCLLCGRSPSDAHHVRFAQPWAVGLKVSDEFTVPLCRAHHRELHRGGSEAAWWEDMEIDPLEIAKGLWEQTRSPPLQPVTDPDPRPSENSDGHK